MISKKSHLFTSIFALLFSAHILVSAAEVAKNKITLEELINLLEARENSIQNISVNYLYKAIPLEDFENYNRDFVFMDKLKRGSMSVFNLGIARLPAFPTWKKITKLYQCEYRTDFQKIFYSEIENAIETNKEVMCFDGKYYLSYRPYSKHKSVSFSNPIFPHPFYTDYLFKFHFRIPVDPARAVAQTTPTIVSWLKEVLKSNTYRLTEKGDELLLEAAAPRGTNGYYAANYTFDLSKDFALKKILCRGLVSDPNTIFSTPRQGEEDDVFMEDFVEVQPHLWFPRKITAIARWHGYVKSAQKMIQEQGEEMRKKVGHITNSVYTVLKHKFIVSDIQVNLPLSVEDFYLPLDEGREVYDRFADRNIEDPEELKLLPIKIIPGTAKKQ